MKSFDAEGLLQEVVERLTDPLLSTRIDAPLERAMDTFSFVSPETWTGSEFDSTLILLVQHLHLHAADPSRRTPPHEAFAEGRSMIAESYVSQGGRGYDAALVDVAEEGTETFDAVIDCVVDAYRERKKRTSVDWVIHCAVAPLDWQQRCRMASALMRAGKDDLPKAVLDSQPARFADNLADLIMAHVQAEGCVEQFKTRWAWDLHRFRFAPCGRWPMAA